MKINDRSAVIETHPVQWEYLSLTMGLHENLSQFGTDGWELVAVVSIPHDPAMAKYHFKRRRG